MKFIAHNPDEPVVSKYAKGHLTLYDRDLGPSSWLHAKLNTGAVELEDWA